MHCFTCVPAGPTPETITDFWQMVLDVRPAVIVMLTKVDENGKVTVEGLCRHLYTVAASIHCQMQQQL